MFLQNVQVPVSDVQFNSVFFEEASAVARVLAACLHINKEVSFTISLQGCPDIFRTAGFRIRFSGSQHTADFEIRVNFMCQLGRFGRCHQLMVRSLIFDLLRIIFAVQIHAAAKERNMQNHIDFIKSQPVLDFITVAFKQNLCII